MLVSALKHLGQVLRWSFSGRVGVVYVPFAQNFPGLFRDLAFVMIARIARRPVVLHLHGGLFDSFFRSQPRPMRFLLRRVLGGASLGIVLSENLRPALECVLASERIVAVPNGIDFTPGTSSREDEHVHVLFLSVLYEWKGVFVFIDSFAAAQKNVPSLRATVAGSWPSDLERKRAVLQAQRHCVDDLISFPGFVEGEEKAALFASADIFCFASLVPEGHPLVIIEAMASALPVVAPAWPGVAAAVVDGETGLLVAEPEVDSIAECLVDLARQPNERERLGRAGQRRYEQLYTQDAFGERIIAALQPVLERAGVVMSTVPRS